MLSDREREEQMFIARVMSRLYAAPFRMQFKTMAEMWGYSKTYVSTLVNRHRGLVA